MALDVDDEVATWGDAASGCDSNHVEGKLDSGLDFIDSTDAISAAFVAGDEVVPQEDAGLVAASEDDTKVVTQGNASCLGCFRSCGCGRSVLSYVHTVPELLFFLFVTLALLLFALAQQLAS